MNAPNREDGLFRRRAIERQSELESIDVLLRVTAPHEWIIATVLAALLMLGIAWSVLGRIELGLEIDGVLAMTGERGVIVSPVSGRVLEFVVRPGDEVPAGAHIAFVEPATQPRPAAAVEMALPDAGDATGASGASVPKAELQAARSVSSARRAEITALFLDPGEIVNAGTPLAQVLFERPGPAEAVAFLELQDAQALRPGMPAEIHFGAIEGEDSRVFQGELRALSEPRPLPVWLSISQLGTDVAGDRLGRLARFSISQPVAEPFSDLAPLRIDVSTGRMSPLQLLGFR